MYIRIIRRVSQPILILRNGYYNKNTCVYMILTAHNTKISWNTCQTENKQERKKSSIRFFFRCAAVASGDDVVSNQLNFNSLHMCLMLNTPRECVCLWCFGSHFAWVARILNILRRKMNAKSNDSKTEDHMWIEWVCLLAVQWWYHRHYLSDMHKNHFSIIVIRRSLLHSTL